MVSCLPLYPTPAAHERAGVLLCRTGARFAGVTLRPMDLLVVMFLAGQGPGAFWHQTTIAEAIGVSHDTIHDSLNRLRNRGPKDDQGNPTPHPEGYGFALVHSERVKIGTWLLGAREKTKTKLCKYWLTFELMEALDAEEAHRARMAAKKRELRLVDEPAPPASSPAPRPPRSSGPDLTWAEPEIQALAAAFDALELPTSSGKPRRPCSTSELQALRNRLREGCTLDDMRAAIVGAYESSWTRSKGGDPWAADPFAVVFCHAPAVRKFAARGREAAARGASTPAAARPSVPSVPSSKTEPIPSSTGSPRSIDRETTYKTSTAAEPGPSADPPSAPRSQGVPPTAAMERSRADSANGPLEAKRDDSPACSTHAESREAKNEKEHDPSHAPALEDLPPRPGTPARAAVEFFRRTAFRPTSGPPPAAPPLGERRLELVRRPTSPTSPRAPTSPPTGAQMRLLRESDADKAEIERRRVQWCHEHGIDPFLRRR